MTCDQLEIWISAYQDGELDPRRRRLLDQHLSACSECRALGEEMAALATTLRAGLEQWDPPDTLHTRVMCRIPEPKRVPAPGGRTPRGWLSFGLVPAGLLAAWLLAVEPRIVPHPPVKAPPAVGAVRSVTPPEKPRMASDAAPAAEQGSAQKTAPSLPQRRSAGTSMPTSTGHIGHSGVQGGSSSQPKGAVQPKSESGRPAGARDSGVRRAPRTERELEPLRRLRKLRPPRWQERMVGWHRRRPAMRLVKGPGPASTDLHSRTEPRRARITVVDYVLPEVPPPTTQAETTKTKTEFVLRATEPYQVSAAAYDY
jgi:Putative zinc-finger